MTDCTHCWHLASSQTMTFGNEGMDKDICCQCGTFRKRWWRLQPDPKHGQYAPHADGVKVYKDIVESS